MKRNQRVGLQKRLAWRVISKNEEMGERLEERVELDQVAFAARVAPSSSSIFTAKMSTAGCPRGGGGILGDL